ncbi:MAG: phosphoribosylamine--glycine ligase [Desulfonatronovibrionaceae bacterium]
MRILIVGSGGREHALAWKINKSPLTEKLYIAPGNGGTAALGENIPVEAADIPSIVHLCREKKIDLVVVGPEEPLVLGLSNSLEKEGIPCFGPGAFCAQLEGSKAFAKSLMTEAEVPTADYAAFDEFETAKNYVRATDPPLVIKADGLAAGKGVVVAESQKEAVNTLEEMMVREKFGSAGKRVVIEEALQGEEVSFLAFCDGHDIALLPSSQDHKRIGEGDTGPNTGGMGAYSPAPVLPPENIQQTAELVIRPIVQHLEGMDRPFKGVLYAGLIITAQGPKVLEYNVRFGDPECQPLLMRLDCDLVDIMLACVQGNLKEKEIKIKPEHSMCLVLAAGGYPGRYEKGQVISGLREAESLYADLEIFHAGTAINQGKTVTNGGRVLGVTGLGKDLREARDKVYAAAERISFKDVYFRRDIGMRRL